jgi:hypothetical protein
MKPAEQRAAAGTAVPEDLRYLLRWCEGRRRVLDLVADSARARARQEEVAQLRASLEQLGRVLDEARQVLLSEFATDVEVRAYLIDVVGEAWEEYCEAQAACSARRRDALRW